MPSPQPTIGTESSIPQPSQGQSNWLTELLVVPLAALNRSSLPLAGGKGANLGEMMRAGLPIPPGFCVTTHAYTQVADDARLAPVLAALESTGQGSDRLAALAADARAALLAAPVPDQVRDAVLAAYATLCAEDTPVAVAVRSSATAEDLPEASFAGQQDTYLNIIGPHAVLDAVRRCWASLWTDRAVAYRTANDIDHRTVKLAVVVQQLVPATVSGVLFTANPLTNRRQEAVIDAAPGLGEALVSGMVNPDHFVVDLRSMAITERDVAVQRQAILPQVGGGTGQVTLPDTADANGSACLTDQQVLEIARLGAEVEAHYRAPQDIEWALDPQGWLWLLQARPITTLFPLPDVPGADPDAVHLYFSASTAQGVLQPLTPMGLDLFRRIGAAIGSLLGFSVDPVHGPTVIASAAGRLYVELTPLLQSPFGRRIVLKVLGQMEPRTGEALHGILADPRLASPAAASKWRVARRLFQIALRTRLPVRAAQAFLWPDRARRAADARVRALLVEAARPTQSPAEALMCAERLVSQIPQRVMLQFFSSILLPGLGSFMLVRQLARAIDAEEAALLVTRGLAHNPTTEMDLQLWHISRRLHEDHRSLLTETAPHELARRYLTGELPAEVQRTIAHFLHRYGFRSIAEIDIGVARWEEDPAYIFGVIANYLRLEKRELAPDAQFHRAAAEAQAAMERLVAQARRAYPLGWARTALLRLLLRRVRALLGMREAPKFYAVAIIGRCRKLLQEVGVSLVQAGRLDQTEDIFFLTFAEAHTALAGADLRQRVQERRADYVREMKRRRIPRLLLSDGTALYGEPAAAQSAASGHLTGSPASPGVYTGVARVVMDPASAHLQPDEVLVAPSTDPGWTPLFLTAGALVMEMGGMMSHGAVVAREYGIPAVVGVVDATSAIQTGQVIMVDGERGIVVIVSDEPSRAAGGAGSFEAA